MKIITCELIIILIGFLMKFRKHIENYFPDFIHSDDVLSLPSMTKIVETKNLSSIVSWPPNVFLILYTLLEYTDKYRLIVSPQGHFKWDSKQLKNAQYLSKEWNEYLKLSFGGKKVEARSFIEYNLRKIFSEENLNTSTYKLLNNHEFSRAVFKMIISIDELFSDINICDSQYKNILSLMLLLRDTTLRQKNKVECLWLDKDEYLGINNLADNDCRYAFVTYKTSVPQTGLTINNLTHYLTVIKPAVKPRVIVNKLENNIHDKKSYNILFLPWPLEISPDSFKSSSSNIIETDSYFDFFDYSPIEEIKINMFISALISTIDRVGTIDLIVLPECAVNDKMFEKLKNILFSSFGKHSPSLLSGIYGKDIENNCAKNAAKLAFIGESRTFDTVEQKKHHRWFLDRNQLRNYNLAGALDPGKKWWENISVERRNLLIVHTLNGVRLCPLICEDLARQEPVAQAVRAIGPNLVISLLLDGPQLKGRWPGKYSAVLSDDPGASVFSVTALGMTMRSTGLGDDPSRGVALWSEPQNGAETLELKKDSIGIILELEIKNETMWSMDGRQKDKQVLRKKHWGCIPLEYDAPVPFLKKRLDKAIYKTGLAQ